VQGLSDTRPLTQLRLSRLRQIHNPERHFTAPVLRPFRPLSPSPARVRVFVRPGTRSFDLCGEASAFSGAHANRALGDFLRGALHLVSELGAAGLGLGIEIGKVGHLDEVFLRLLEAGDRIALPRFRLPSLRI